MTAATSVIGDNSLVVRSGETTLEKDVDYSVLYDAEQDRCIVELLGRFAFAGFAAEWTGASPTTKGMPAVVREYVEQGTFEGSLDIQRQLIADYREDIRKYAEGLDQGRILNVFDQIPPQLAIHGIHLIVRLIAVGCDELVLGLLYEIDIDHIFVAALGKTLDRLCLALLICWIICGR